MNKRTKWSAQLFVVLLCALALKRYYSTASVDELGWILGPTTWLTQLLSGRTFSFESHAGYMSSDHAFLIAASCAGVNFLITSFLMLTIRHSWRQRSKHNQEQLWRQWVFLPIAVVMAYATTVVANTARISIALQMQQTSWMVRWLDAEQLHRLEGVFVYFGFLLLLFVLWERARLTSGRELKPLGLLRLCFYPLVIYYAMTLGLPLANGAYRQSSFWEHAVFVVLAPVAIVLLIGGLGGASRRMRKSYSVAHSVPFAVADGLQSTSKHE